MIHLPERPIHLYTASLRLCKVNARECDMPYHSGLCASLQGGQVTSVGTGPAGPTDTDYQPCAAPRHMSANRGVERGSSGSSVVTAA